MPVIRTSETRRSQTPAATMTTLASPTLGAADRPIWRVDVAAEAPRPAARDRRRADLGLHRGGAEVELAGESSRCAPATPSWCRPTPSAASPGPRDRVQRDRDRPGRRPAWTLPREGGIVPPWTA